MVFKESPMVNGIDRKISFQQYDWIEKELFESILNSNFEIFPFLKKKDNENIYIGKYLPRQQLSYSNINDLSQIRSETIGHVEKDFNGSWKLILIYNYVIYEIKNDFLILSFKNPNSFNWVESESDQIPKYALKAGIDEQVLEFVYIGCTVSDSKYASGHYYFDGWHEINQISDISLGRYRINDKALHIVTNGLEVKCSKFKILCLKPSPASLKELCKIAIRCYTKKTNTNIKLLSDYMPLILIDYLKYPSYLNMGDYLLKGEKLISEDDKYELYIDDDNYLVCKNSITNSRLILYNHSFVDSIWLQKLQTIFFFSNLPNFFLACIFYEYPLLYKFQLCTKHDHPRFIFKIFNKLKGFSNNQILYNYFSHYDETYLKYFLDNSVN